jgi:hypothetical protein
MARAKGEADRPRRTRAHVIASLSQNYVERFVLEKGHTVERSSADYGFDLAVNTFDDQGCAENGQIRIQLKASDRPDYTKEGTAISLEITRKHYELWMGEIMPVFLILYDAQEKMAYWIHVQQYFLSDRSRRPSSDLKTFSLQIPTANQITEATIDYMRECKATVLTQRQRR